MHKDDAFRLAVVFRDAVKARVKAQLNGLPETEIQGFYDVEVQAFSEIVGALQR